jgi:hypothetical protein
LIVSLEIRAASHHGFEGTFGRRDVVGRGWRARIVGETTLTSDTFNASENPCLEFVVRQHDTNGKMAHRIGATFKELWAEYGGAISVGVKNQKDARASRLHGREFESLLEFSWLYDTLTLYAVRLYVRVTIRS